MKVDISSLVKNNGKTMEVELEGFICDDWFDINSIYFDKPARFSGHLTNNAGVLDLTGYLEVSLKAECFRCLKGIDSSLRMEVHEVFASSKAQEKTDEQYAYEGDILELDDVLKDNVLLNLPMKQVCSEECRGLCPGCGIDLNHAVCSCKGEDTDPRLKVLEKLLNNSQ